MTGWSWVGLIFLLWLAVANINERRRGYWYQYTHPGLGCAFWSFPAVILLWLGLMVWTVNT